MKRGSLPAVVLACLVLVQGCAPPRSSASAPPPAVSPTPPALRASENPPDVPARMPFRPTPMQPESKFPPPQQSEEDEKRTSNRPGEPELLHAEPAVLLDGEPFPAKETYDPKFPEARRTRYVSADTTPGGDGSVEHPWRDLQEAFCRLEPGDRLVIAAGVYSGAFRIGDACRDGTADAPIQVFARHAFLKASGEGDVLTVERAHWQFWEVQIALLDSNAAGFVTAGAGAHDIAIDQSHIYEGRGPAVRLAAGSSGIVLSNCHIHQSTGVRIESGASNVTLVNNHIHHNRSASVTIGGGPAGGGPARDITLAGNRIHNDRGPALDLSNCERVTVSRNRLSNYRPDEEDRSGGEAIRVRSGCRDVIFDSGSVLEATTAIRVGDSQESGRSPEHVVIRRSYFKNQLTRESRALVIDSGRDVLFVNNVVEGYAEPVRTASAAVSGISIANNLILKPAVALTLGSPGAVSLFDYNVFGADSSLRANVGGTPLDAVPWMRIHMPHSKVLPGLGLSGGDLAKVIGFSPVDAGTRVEGVDFRGAAPDIGVAER